jgi:UDP-N-acetylglucosamine 2-epimerase (non-hydrolysing)
MSTLRNAGWHQHRAPMKVLTVLGTRPEAIKMAPVIKQLAKHPDAVRSMVCVTGQHRQMLDQVLGLFDIRPNYDLDVMKPGQTPTQVAAAVLSGLGPILSTERPDWMLVQGDTTTAMAASIAAFFHQVKIGHVEAGLRTHNRHQPFPEEINRKIVSVVADLHFAPTQRARENLLREGIPDATIMVTGNPVIDALHMLSDVPYDPATGALADIPWKKRLILVTAHRRESFGKPMEEICWALRDLADGDRPGMHMVFPVHPNPNVRDTVHRILGNQPNVTLVPPLDYLPFVYLMKHATLVVTDSGGIQEEAPGLGIPVLVLREVTERPEAVDAGTVRLVGTDRQRITFWVRRLLNDEGEYQKMARAVNPYGDGFSAQRIVKILLGEEPQ